jgi:hypothetical protein
VWNVLFSEKQSKDYSRFLKGIGSGSVDNDPEGRGSMKAEGVM